MNFGFESYVAWPCAFKSNYGSPIDGFSGWKGAMSGLHNFPGGDPRVSTRTAFGPIWPIGRKADEWFLHIEARSTEVKLASLQDCLSEVAAATVHAIVVSPREVQNVDQSGDLLNCSTWNIWNIGVSLLAHYIAMFTLLKNSLSFLNKHHYVKNLQYFTLKWPWYWLSRRLPQNFVMQMFHSCHWWSFMALWQIWRVLSIIQWW